MKLPVIVPHYSRKILLCASVLLFGAALPSHLLAASEYGVDNVAVDADGKDATDARTKALAQGEKSAFAQLILQMHPPSAADIFAHVTPVQVHAMVRGFTVIEEKITPTHYHATLNYSFDPQQIQKLAPAAAAAPAATPAPAAPVTPPAQIPTPAAAPVPASTPAAIAEPERARKAVLVLPVYNDGGALELWQDENKWRNLWYDAALESGGGLVVVPLGDFSDRVDVDDTNVNAASSTSLKRMYDRYGVGDIIVMSAVFDQKADPKPTLIVTLRALSGNPAETKELRYTIHSTETLDTLLVRASNDIAQILYKQQTLDPNKMEYDRVKEINARVNTTSIKEWQALRQKLLLRNNIVDVKFVSISYYETSMVITYKGTSDMLGKTLVASGLRVLEDGNSLVLSLK